MSAVLRRRGPVALRFRRKPKPADADAVRALARRTGVFTAEECAVAGELVYARLELGGRSGYHFVFVDRADDLVGYVAWGPIPMTRASYDLYWIIVDPTCQGTGLGRDLMRRTEEAVLARGGGAVYIETSSVDRYARTRRFYRRAGYRQVARLSDFYAPGDHKIVFCKTLIRNA
ncbi:MAG TPA: GNAT family N-acetyltransferase [Gammaproteobacteria bacterium]|nr:GNAT family N-acetyltransferase [Gammaproteobacteria bacterium]